MIQVKYYLDKRSQKKDGTYPLKARINHKKVAAFINMNIYLTDEQWDERNEKTTKDFPNREFINRFLLSRKVEIQNIGIKLAESGYLASHNIYKVRDKIIEELEGKEVVCGLFYKTYKEFTETRRKKRTTEIYQSTLNWIEKFDKNISSRSFEEIDRNWLRKFYKFMEVDSPSINARNIHLRNIRAVFNYAIDEEITTFYPFRKMQIKNTETVKRSISAEQLNDFFNADTDDTQTKYLDIFKLTFYLIGINIVDLVNLKEITPEGRIEYYRSKTNRFYSIKVEPEALDIINRYRGKKNLLDMMDRYTNYKDYAKRLNENLQKIGVNGLKSVEIKGKTRNIKTFIPMFPNITTYWARHTWATIASKLEIPKETIAAALGHGGKTVTDIYIDFDRDKIDKANRLVIDYVSSIKLS